MTFTNEEHNKIMGVLKKINEYVGTIPLEEEFYIECPLDNVRFRIDSERKWENGKAVGRNARIVLENRQYSPSCLSRVIEKDEIFLFPNEIELLIKNWNYVKGEILLESKKQQERKQRLNDRLDCFTI